MDVKTTLNTAETQVKSAAFGVVFTSHHHPWLRVSSGGIRVWTHYDVMDNIYCQVLGHKRAVLWAPDQVDNMYLTGDKSSVIDIDNPDTAKYPR